MTFKRIDRIKYYTKIAKLVALRSTCSRAQVGAVLVYNNRIVATGYNGSPPGEAHCIDIGCLIHEGHCIRTIHAEMNALLHLEHNYSRLIMFCTHEPCKDCFKHLYSVGVREFYFINLYKDLARDRFILNLLGGESELIYEQVD